MVDEAAFPVLFGTTQATWALIDLRFQLLTGEVDPDRVARVYVVPFIGAACVVLGFEHGDWGPAGGGLDPGESIRTALARELAEEAGGRLLTYTPFAVLRCHSRAATPGRVVPCRQGPRLGGRPVPPRRHASRRRPQGTLTARR
jgi:8-oxo-dGTP pyrophosphatase MutT (NUDIX family)